MNQMLAKAENLYEDHYNMERFQEEVFLHFLF
jgi:hypothetical protein